MKSGALALVTMGWIVILQVGLLLIDRFQYGVHLAPGKWVAVGVILVAQGYLLLGPGGSNLLRHPRLRCIRPGAATERTAPDDQAWTPGLIAGTR